MFQNENLACLARKYKGAPLACLWVLLFTRQRVTQSYLESVTGYTDKTISSALAYLKEDGLIDHEAHGWMLSEGTQLVLAAPSAELPQIVESRRISDPPISSSSINLINNFDLDTATTTTSESRNNSEVWKLLESVGIFHNKTTDKLAGQLTAAQVRKVIRQLSLENKPLPQNAGLLINRLKNPINLEIDFGQEKHRKYSDWEQ